MSHLSQRLLNNLEEYYDQIILMWKEEIEFEEAVDRLKISEEELTSMYLVIFNEYPRYHFTNLFGQNVHLEFNAHTLQFKEIRDVNETL